MTDDAHRARWPALAFILCLIPCLATDVMACSCVDTDEMQRFASAKAVMLVEITTTRLVKSGIKDEIISTDEVEAEFTVLEHFKRATPAVTIVRERVFSSAGCSIGLMSGGEYLLFVSSQGELDNDVGLCTGSRAFDANDHDAAAQLERLRALAL